MCREDENRPRLGCSLELLPHWLHDGTLQCVPALYPMR
jgi:hypothetical protein